MNKRIRIVDCENKVGSWYANCIGKDYEVLSESPYHYYVHGGGAIKKGDAVVIGRISVPVKIDISDDVLEVLANVSKKLVEFERRIDELTEQLQDYRGDYLACGSGIEELDKKVEMVIDDIMTLDERTQVINAIHTFYERGEH